jgi:hypothetical protein
MARSSSPTRSSRPRETSSSVRNAALTVMFVMLPLSAARAVAAATPTSDRTFGFAGSTISSARATIRIATRPTWIGGSAAPSVAFWIAALRAAFSSSVAFGSAYASPTAPNAAASSTANRAACARSSAASATIARIDSSRSAHFFPVV